MEIGDKVSWTHVSTRGRSMLMSLREGIITAMESKATWIKKKGGKSEVVSLARLRLPEHKSQITEFVEGLHDYCTADEKARG